MTGRRLHLITLAGALLVALVFGGASMTFGASYDKSPPTGLKASDKSNASITLTWTRTSGINRYAIQYSTSSTFSNPKYRVPDNVTSQSVAFAAVRDLEPATAYYFRIRSTYANGSNASDWSKSVKISTSTYAFGAPSTPKLTNVLSTSADVSWSEVPNAGKYRVAYSTSSTFASSVPTKYVYPVDNKVTLTGLTTGVKYYVKVRALESKSDDNGDPYLLTGYSSVANFTTTTFTAQPPANFKVVGNYKDTFVLSWTATPGANGYRVQTTYGTTKRYLASNETIPAGAGSFTQSGNTVTATLKKFCDAATSACSAYVPGKSYAFAVTAKSGDTRISDYTAQTSAIATALPLSTPNDFTLKGTTSGSFTLSWQRVAGAASYRLQEKKSSTSGETRYLYNICGTNSPVTCTYDGDTISVTLTSFTSNSTGVSTPFTAKSTYYLKVTAQANVPGAVADSYPQFDDRASEYTAAYLKATTDAFSLRPPPLSTDKRDVDSVTLSWPSVTGANAYVVDRTTDTTFAKVDSSTCVDLASLNADPLNPPGTTTFKRKFGGLNDETSYFFRIRVVNNCTSKAAQSENSSIISVRTTAGAGSLTGQVVGGSNPGNLADARSTMTATAYAYQDGQTGSNQEVAGTADVNPDGTYTINGLRPGKYQVQLSQNGDKNYTSPWVSGKSAASEWADDSHEFQVKAGIYTVAGSGGSLTLPNTPVNVGGTLSGTVVRVIGGAAQKDVTVTAIGAPVDTADLTREVRDIDVTDANGHYSFTGLFPDKYKITLGRSVSSPLRGSSFWVNPLASHPVINVGVCLASETTAVCTPTPGSNDNNQ